MKKSITLTIVTMVVMFVLYNMTQNLLPKIDLIPNVEAAAACPSHNVFMTRNGDFCVLWAEYCIEGTQSYYLRYDETDLNGWQYVLLYNNPINICQEGCYYYTCAKGPINCEAYV